MDKTLPMSVHKISDLVGYVYCDCEIGFRKERTVDLEIMADNRYIDRREGETSLAKQIGEIITK